MILDAIGSFLCFMLALSCFIMHVLSSPKREHWLNLPNYVRVGLFLTGAMIMFRGINLAILSDDNPPTMTGHMNLEAFCALVVLNYTFTVLTIHVLRKTFPVRVWARLNYIESLATCANNGSLAILASLGVKVVPPGAGPEAVEKATKMTDNV